jgi:hypothetical protein
VRLKVKRLEKNLTLDEVIARMEELAQEFATFAGDLQRGFEILREFLQLSGQWSVLKKTSR